MYPRFVLELKADLTLDDCIEFINTLTENGEKKFQNLYVALPFTRLKEITTQFPNTGITFGSSMLNRTTSGAFPAVIATKMVKDAHGTFVLVGTSDERNVLHLSDAELEAKLISASQGGLKPIYIVSAVEKEGLVKQLQVLKASHAIDFFRNLSPQDLAERGKARSKRSDLNEEGMAIAMHDEEDRSGKAAAGQSPGESYERSLDPIIIYELPFKSFKSYLPTNEELGQFKTLLLDALTEVFGSEGKFRLIASLPSDLVGFSSLIESMPFDGASFTKTGVYPHAVHQETIKLFHVNSVEQEEMPPDSFRNLSPQDLTERGKARSKRSGPIEESPMAIAMGDEEDRSGKAAAGQIPGESFERSLKEPPPNPKRTRKKTLEEKEE